MLPRGYGTVSINHEADSEQDPNIVCGTCQCSRCCCITSTVGAAVTLAACGFFAFPAVKLATVGAAAAKTALVEEINIVGAAASLFGTVVAGGWCVNGCIVKACHCCANNDPTEVPTQIRMGC